MNVIILKPALRFNLLTFSLLLFLSCDPALLNENILESEYVEPETTITITNLDGDRLCVFNKLSISNLHLSN